MADAKSINGYNLKDAAARQSIANLDTVKLASSGGASGSIRFGVDGDGNYGYFKAGADTVTPFKSATKTPVAITKANSSGAYIFIVDLDNNRSVRLSANNGQSVTIGDVTYTSKGVSSNNPSFSINKNGVKYTPAISGQPTQAEYTSGTKLVLGNGDGSFPTLILFSPS